jgi:hypothetical protein
MAIVNKTFSEFSQKPASKKAILAHLEPTKRLVTWDLHAGAVYKRTVDYFVINVFNDTTAFAEGASESLNLGEFYFDPSNKTLYLRMADDSNPQSSFISAQFRLFFSDTGYVLSYDLTDTGFEIEYEGLIESASNFKQELDNAELLGISLESEGKIGFINKSGYWDPIFDTLFFENKPVRIYSWFPETPFSEAKLIFEGEIEDGSFSASKVSFRVKDFIYRLRQPVALELFGQSDGDISEDVKGVIYKRRVYGQVNGLKTQSLDQTLEGVSLAGTISGNLGSRTITGSGSSFLSEVSPGDEISFELFLTRFQFRVDSIESDSSLTISEEIEKRFAGISATLKPEIPLRTRNRSQFVAGHKLREPTVTITEGLQPNRFRMDATDFFVNDTIKVGAETARIKRISDDIIVLFQNLDTFPTIGTTVTKNPIRAAYFNQKELLIDRDFTVSNTATDCKITLTDTAEFNIAIAQKVEGTTSFNNGSRSVTGSGFKAILKSRDWIKSNDIAHQIWYEILEVVDDNNLLLRIAYAGTNTSGDARRKNVNYVGDESVVTVDCIGKEDATGKWVKTASDVVLDLIQNDAGITAIDTAAFAEAKIDNDYIMSLKLPLNPDGEPKTIRETINLVNKSVFGSLIAKSNFQVAYNVLTPDKPETLEELGDDDLIGGPENNFSVNTKTDIRRKITVRYNHFDADRYTGEKGNDSTEYENAFVDNLIGTKDEKTVDAYLFDELNAQTIAERYALIHSLKQNVITVKAKLNLTLQNLNDKIYLNISRLFDRFGGSAERRKIGIISRIARGATETSVTFSDLSNQFNRVGTIADNDSSEFTTAPDDEKILNGYIVDNNTEIPGSSDDQWNTNLIG